MGKRTLRFFAMLAALVLSGCGLNVPQTSSSLSSTESLSSISGDESSSATSAESSSKDSSSSKGEESSSSSSEESSSSSSSKEESSSNSQTSSSSSSSVSASSSSTDPEEDPRWPLDFSKRGLAFMDDLGGLILASGKTATYSDAIKIGARAAAYPNSVSSSFIPFYRAPTDANKCYQNDCNREHTWPDSRGGHLFETDPVMVRPTLIKDNSDRGNYFYGLGGESAREWDPACLGYENARGECARLILYCVTAYHSLGVSLSNNPKDSSGAHTMGTLSTLLKWNRDYAPTDFEITVNNRYDEMGYRRNPFVDHPEYAEYIYDDQGLIVDGSTKWYSPISDVEEIDGNKFAIVSQDPKNSGYFMMGDKAKGATIPWYISCSSVRYKDGQIASDSPMVWFTFKRQNDGTYLIKNAAGESLYGYVSGTHTNIGFGRSEEDILSQSSGATSISASWEISASGTQMTIKSSVYLECYNGSYTGYGSAPSLKPMLYA